MNSVDTEKPFPSTDAEWEALIAEAPEAAVDSNAAYDPNDPAAVDAFWADAAVVREGGPAAVRATTLRFDADVLAALKATGKGWQTRVNTVIREWLQTHSPNA